MSFHDSLRATFDESASIEDYAGQLFKRINDDLWAGELTFLPDKMRPYAGLIESAYEGGAKFDAKDLGALAKWVEKQFDSINKELGKVFNGVI